MTTFWILLWALTFTAGFYFHYWAGVDLHADNLVDFEESLNELFADVDTDKMSAEEKALLLKLSASLLSKEAHKKRKAKKEEALKNAGYKYQIGGVYETQAGEMVTVLGRADKFRGYESLICSDDKHRYDRSTHSSDAGRVTGTEHDYSCPDNFKREFK